MDRENKACAYVNDDDGSDSAWCVQDFRKCDEERKEKCELFLEGNMTPEEIRQQEIDLKLEELSKDYNKDLMIINSCIAKIEDIKHDRCYQYEQDFLRIKNEKVL